MLIKQMINIVQYIHDKYLVHCDLKPENFVYNKVGNIKLIDFGES